jgi:hypothetical protein
LQKTGPLLSDFGDFSEIEGLTKTAEQDVAIPYPFQLQVEKYHQGKLFSGSR